MSRSTKIAGYVDRNPWAKNQANRRIRRKPVSYDIPDGCGYRREYQQYYICDWKSLYYGNKQQIKDEIRQWCWVSEDDVDRVYYQTISK